MSLNIPPIGTRGLYSLKAPFVTKPNTLYTCSAIRYFKDITNQGVNVFVSYYEPYGLTQSVFDKDRSDNVAIVTLLCDTEAPLYVPSSYILSFPNLNSVNYHHVVLSVSLGALPEYLDLTFLKNQIQGDCSDVIGVTPTVLENVSELTGRVSPEEHDTLTAAREAAKVNRPTDHAEVVRLTNENTTLKTKLTALEALAISKNWV